MRYLSSLNWEGGALPRKFWVPTCLPLTHHPYSTFGILTHPNRILLRYRNSQKKLRDLSVPLPNHPARGGGVRIWTKKCKSCAWAPHKQKLGSQCELTMGCRLNEGMYLHLHFAMAQKCTIQVWPMQ